MRVESVMEATLLLLVGKAALLTTLLSTVLPSALLLQGFLHGSLLNIVGKLSGGHSVWFLAVGLELRAAELGLSKSRRCVHDGRLAGVEGGTQVGGGEAGGWGGGGW